MMDSFFGAIGFVLGCFFGLWIICWIIWEGIKALGRKIRNWAFGPEDITP